MIRAAFYEGAGSFRTGTLPGPGEALLRVRRVGICGTDLHATPESALGLPIARTLGNCLSVANLARLVDLVGPARTTELIFRARLVPAEEARALGLLHEVVPADRLEAHVREVAAELAAHAPLTLAATKEALRRLARHRRPAEAEDLIGRVYKSQDFREGVRAFLERRPPRFQGR